MMGNDMKQPAKVKVPPASLFVIENRTVNYICKLHPSPLHAKFAHHKTLETETSFSFFLIYYHIWDR